MALNRLYKLYQPCKLSYEHPKKKNCYICQSSDSHFTRIAFQMMQKKKNALSL